MSVISHFTKGIEIEDYRGHMHLGRNEGNISLIQEYFNNKYRHPLYSNPSLIKRIQVSDHALNRWNERVGPITDKYTLEQVINTLFFQIRCGVEFEPQDVGVIDNDIVFTYYKENDTIVISTFYGRKSLNFILNSFIKLRRFNKYKSEKIDLSIPSEVLDSQLLPPIPSETMIFQGSWTKYYMEKYTDYGSSWLFIHELSGEKHGRVIPVDLTLPPSEKLSQSILRAIYLMGYSDYVYQHVQHFKGEQLQKYLQKLQLHIPA
ncbi:hypothetical protein [Brevibacillus choshinensis]|uniref:WYL domain-containing protein n=1 Tax=Brevibacillus choshinensis TaxID=54911 RepID=A0ABX7FJP1_BRECH|nr:hypothetical protein [Brevibacillus choshinensis]QRG65993.1 hypothetical protein JNE38_20765 [Brevibacillus choshinensis]